MVLEPELPAHVYDNNLGREQHIQTKNYHRI